MAFKTEDGLTLVKGRSMVRDHFAGFYRAGLLWPNAGDDLLALATDRALAVLKSDRMLTIDTDVSLPKGTDASALPRADIADIPFLDPDARALDLSRSLDKKIEAKRAELLNSQKLAALDLLNAGDIEGADKILNAIALKGPADQSAVPAENEAAAEVARRRRSSGT